MAGVVPYVETAVENGLANRVMNWVKFVYGGGMLKGITEILTLSDANANFTDVWNLAEALYNGIASVGVALIGLYFLLDILEKVQSDNLNYEHIIKSCCKFFFASVIMNEGFNLFTGGISFASSLVTSLGASSFAMNNDAALTEWNAELSAIPKGFMGTISAIGPLIEMLIPYAMMQLVKIVINVVAYGRFVELLVRAVFAPIGMANMYDGGMNSSGCRYFKKFIAVGIQGGIILVIVNGLNVLATAVVENATSLGEAATAPLLQLIIGFTCVTLILKSSSWANDVMGV